MSRFNDVIRRLGTKSSNATLVDAEAIFRAASHPYTPGFDLFLDYVHPTKKGNLILAKSVFDAIVASGRLGPAAAPFQHVPEINNDGKSYDENEDYSMQMVLLWLEMQMHQNETVVDLAGRFMAKPEGLKQLHPRYQKRPVMAHAIFRDIIELERKELLEGGVSPAEKSSVDQRLKELFHMSFANYSEYLREKPR